METHQDGRQLAAGLHRGRLQELPEHFLDEPQYVIKLEEEDEDQEDGESGCTFLVGLIQKHRRRQRKMGEDMHTIGFGIYEVPEELRGRPTSTSAKTSS